MSTIETRESESALLHHTVSRLFADIGTMHHIAKIEAGEWPSADWTALEGVGLGQAGAAIERGGSGLDFSALGAIISLAGYHNVSLPLAETYLAEMMLERAELPPRSGPTTVGPVIRQAAPVLARRSGAYTLSGKLHRVPWARHGQAVVIAAEIDGRQATVVVDRLPAVQAGANLANEPRDTLIFDHTILSEAQVVIEPMCMSVDQLLANGALFRSAAISGALKRAQELTISFAKDRVQFGHPIAKFQAVQHMIAVMASHVAVAAAASEAALASAGQATDELEIAAAKARLSEAAGIVASIAQQVHGAMGISRDYALNFSSRRLWSWREEFGSEIEWSEHIGGMLRQMGSSGVWPRIGV